MIYAPRFFNADNQLTDRLTEMNNLLSKILVVEFAYKSKTYFALIRTKTNEVEKRHYIMIMNSELEQLFYGHHISIDNKAELNSPEEILKAHLLELNKSVTGALDHLLQQEYERLN